MLWTILVRALGRGLIGLPAYVLRVRLLFTVMQFVSICVPPLWFLNFPSASCADARVAVIMFPEVAAKNPRDGLYSCLRAAAMAPASLIRGRALHDFECDARAPGGMAHVVCP